jgi:hypothetical protein
MSPAAKEIDGLPICDGALFVRFADPGPGCDGVAKVRY